VALFLNKFFGVKQVIKAVKPWKKVASKYGISKAQQELKAPAFEIAMES
jgi:hypothetical protein